MNAPEIHEPSPASLPLRGCPPLEHHTRPPSYGLWAAALSGSGASNSDRATADAHQPSLARGPARVLVVDDNVDAADTLTEALELMGFVVRTAYEGESALALAREHQPELAILDIGLPGMDGYALAAALRALHLPRPLHIVALTGYGQPADRQRALEAGFEEHLVKPASLDVIMETLSRLREL